MKTIISCLKDKIVTKKNKGKWKDKCVIIWNE